MNMTQDPRRQVPRLAATLVLLLVLPCFHAGADTLTGKVIKIADGDTITVLAGREQHRIRLQGIDAPERGQPFGRASDRTLTKLVAGKRVRVEYDKRDRYGRLVGKVLVPECPDCSNWLDANLYQVAAGMAWHYKYYQDEQPPADRMAYAAAEEQARAERRGLWQEPDPIAPWNWRRGQRGASQAQGGWCGSHRFCRQMASCADARRALTECGWTKLDGDGDGVPCESLCR